MVFLIVKILQLRTTWHILGDPGWGQIVGARESLNGPEKIKLRDFPSPPLSAPGSPRM